MLTHTCSDELHPCLEATHLRRVNDIAIDSRGNSDRRTLVFSLFKGIHLSHLEDLNASSRTEALTFGSVERLLETGKCSRVIAHGCINQEYAVICSD